VIDTGSGIDAQALRHVFEPYFTTKPVGEGTGLGLAAVMGIVGQHGGAIALTTAPGRGSRFDVLLPLAAPNSV
jgi:signal transduction histidine kinase